jgi:hypothetical protein
VSVRQAYQLGHCVTSKTDCIITAPILHLMCSESRVWSLLHMCVPLAHLSCFSELVARTSQELQTLQPFTPEVLEALQELNGYTPPQVRSRRCSWGAPAWKAVNMQYLMEDGGFIGRPHCQILLTSSGRLLFCSFWSAEGPAVVGNGHTATVCVESCCCRRRRRRSCCCCCCCC